MRCIINATFWFNNTFLSLFPRYPFTFPYWSEYTFYFDFFGLYHYLSFFDQNISILIGSRNKYLWKIESFQSEIILIFQALHFRLPNHVVHNLVCDIWSKIICVKQAHCTIVLYSKKFSCFFRRKYSYSFYPMWSIETYFDSM